MSTPAQLVALEFEKVYDKVNRLTIYERTSTIVPGSRTIEELRSHIWSYSGECWIEHAFYHLGEISMLYKVAMAKREQRMPAPGARR